MEMVNTIALAEMLKLSTDENCPVVGCWDLWQTQHGKCVPQLLDGD